jgi:hypothetical protein
MRSLTPLWPRASPDSLADLRSNSSASRALPHVAIAAAPLLAAVDCCARYAILVLPPMGIGCSSSSKSADRDTPSSITGYVFMLGRGAVSWHLAASGSSAKTQQNDAGQE